MGGNTVLIVFFTFSVDIELHSWFYTAWAKAFDLLDSNPMTSSSSPLQVGERADVAGWEVWKPRLYSIYFYQSCIIKRWGMGPQCQNLWTSTRVCTPTEWVFSILAVMFFIACNTENLFFYPSVTHAERTLLSEIKYVFKLIIAQGSFCFDTPCFDDYSSYSFGKSARLFLQLICPYK